MEQFDAQSLALPDETATEVEIIHPVNGKPTGIFITVMSSEDERAKSLQREMIDKRLNRMQRRGTKPAMTALDFESDAMAKRVACTVSWRGVLWGGKELDCTPDNARMLYSKSPTIRDQVDQTIDDVSLFTKA